MRSKSPQIEKLKRRLDAAQGKIECDLILRGVQYLDVFRCEWLRGDLAIIDGVIVGVEPGLRAKRYFDGKGKWIVPGFIDAHVHVESSMMTPAHFQEAVLPRGTTTAICDPHEIANVLGMPGIRYFLDSSAALQMDLWVMLSSCVPATHLETNGGGTLRAEDLLDVAGHHRALGLAEMMNVPGVLGGDPDVLKKIAAFSGHVLDGHCPLLSGRKLSAYASVGITSCHESSELAEAQEKLEKGMAVWIREGSVAKDLKALIPLLNAASSPFIGFCTDDRNPHDIATEGHIDHLIRSAIASGVKAEVAYRSASWSVARHYLLDRAARRVGALAPGYAADLVILDDPQSCEVHSVLKTGTWVSEMEKPRDVTGYDLKGTVRARGVQAADLLGPQGQVHVIEILEGKIITGRKVARADAEGVCRLSVLERYGKGGKPSNAYVSGFGSLKGAIGSSVGHDSHNLIAVGSDPEDLRLAFAALCEMGGGFCVVKDGKVLASLSLPFGGLMSDAHPQLLKTGMADLKKAARAIGCLLNEPFLQLAFLSLPVIPSLKLTDKGLVDVEAFQIISVSA